MHLDKINILNVTPCRRAHILTEYEEGLVTLAYPRFSRLWMQKYLLPKGMSTHIRVRLEEHGSAVWELIDGVSTVREIIEALHEHFSDEKQFEERIISYIMQLRKDGFVSYILKPFDNQHPAGYSASTPSYNYHRKNKIKDKSRSL